MRYNDKCIFVSTFKVNKENLIKNIVKLMKFLDMFILACTQDRCKQKKNPVYGQTHLHKTKEFSHNKKKKKKQRKKGWVGGYRGNKG